MGKIIKLYNTWRKAKDVFIKPSVKVYFGPWKKDYNLRWLPTKIKLPYWMMFRIINRDVGWKTKWDEARYEWPPQFSIIAFGLSLTITLHGPQCDEFACDDHYWEAILNYVYMNKSGSLKEAIELSGVWTSFKQGGKNYFSVRPGYITPQHLEEYYAAVSEIKRLKSYEDITPIQ